ncbi:MAG TPA: rhombosortase [Polyangiaceae bacterium]|nr:rhombosortase [Polyangiaceae bacterium]
MSAIAEQRVEWAAALMRRGPWLTLLFTACALALGSSREFEFDRALVWQGQWWRVLTGHFVHYGRAHAVGDIVAFFGWGLVIEAISRKLFAATVCVSSFVVGLCVLVLCPYVSRYAGLSAVDVALATVLLGVLWYSPWVRALPNSRALVSIFALGHLAKTAYEFATGAAVLAPDLGPDVRLLPAAHLFGAASGLMVFALHRLRPRADSSRPFTKEKARHPGGPASARARRP